MTFVVNTEEIINCLLTFFVGVWTLDIKHYKRARELAFVLSLPLTLGYSMIYYWIFL